MQADAIVKCALTRLNEAAHAATSSVDATVVGHLIDATTRQIAKLAKESKREPTT